MVKVPPFSDVSHLQFSRPGTDPNIGVVEGLTPWNLSTEVERLGVKGVDSLSLDRGHPEHRVYL